MGMFDWAGDAYNWAKDAVTGGYNAVTGQSSFQAKPYDPAQIQQAQQPWLDGLQQQSQSNVVAPYNEALVREASYNRSGGYSRLSDIGNSIDPNRTQGQLETVAGRYGDDVVRQAASIEGLSDELGRAPSAVDAMVTSKMAEGNTDALARAASTRGANAALQMRETAGANAQANRQLVADAAALKAKETTDRIAARGGLVRDAAGVAATGAATQGNLYGSAGGANLAATQAQAGIQTGVMSGLRDEAALRQDAYTTAAQNAIAQQQNQTQASTAGLTGATQGQSIAAGSVDSANAANAGVQSNNASNSQKTWGGLITGAAGAMFSDIRAKEDIDPIVAMAADPEANDDALEPVNGYSYRYKANVADALGTDRGKRAGVMAQELEQSPAGREVVFDRGGLKALDMPKAVSFSLAANAGLDKRLRLVEQALGRSPRAA